jgi:hypothetical protein
MKIASIIAWSPCGWVIKESIRFVIDFGVEI